MDAIAEIKRLYYATTRATIQRDIEKAIDLLKTLTTEEDRERATVYMDGLSQMRSEWGVRPAAAGGGTTPRAGAAATRAARRPPARK
jgi:hypothetical protein